MLLIIISLIALPLRAQEKIVHSDTLFQGDGKKISVTLNEEKTLFELTNTTGEYFNEREIMDLYHGREVEIIQNNYRSLALIDLWPPRTKNEVETRTYRLVNNQIRLLQTETSLSKTEINYYLLVLGFIAPAILILIFSITCRKILRLLAYSLVITAVAAITIVLSLSVGGNELVGVIVGTLGAAITLTGLNPKNEKISDFCLRAQIFSAVVTGALVGGICGFVASTGDTEIWLYLPYLGIFFLAGFIILAGQKTLAQVKKRKQTNLAIS